MKLIPTQDEHDFASSLRAMLTVQCPPTVARSHEIPDSLWRAVVDAGVLGLGLPGEYGGSGGTLADLGVFCMEAGRALCPTLVHNTAIAAFGISVLGGPSQREKWLPAVTSGQLRATSALCHPRDAAVVTPQLIAKQDCDGWRVTGAVDFVPDADLADLVVVTAADEATQRAVAFVVALDGATIEPLSLMGGYRASRVVFDDVAVRDPAAVLDGGGAGLGEDDLRRVANATIALFSLDLVGVGGAVVDRTVDYLLTRHQFGRPIASFQAAQHLIANMHIALSAARLAARSSVFWIGKGRCATRETAIARMQCGPAAKLITLDAHQLHGGMGYVVETDLHLWSERARVLSTFGGGADIAAAWLQHEMGNPCDTA